jgi:hypothetical protein
LVLCIWSMELTNKVQSSKLKNRIATEGKSHAQARVLVA